MSKKLRPTFVCRCGGTVSAGCWVMGEKTVEVGVTGKVYKLSDRGYWEMSCDKCSYKGKYTP